MNPKVESLSHELDLQLQIEPIPDFMQSSKGEIAIDELKYFENILSSSLSEESHLGFSSSFSAGAYSFEEEFEEEFSRIKDSIDDLSSTARKLNSMGHLDECVQVYVRARKSFLNATFRKLDIKKLTIRDIQNMGWQNLEKEIERWTEIAPFCVRTLFRKEKRLSHEIFEGIGIGPDINVDAYFIKIVTCFAAVLFSFVRVVSAGRLAIAPEKLFKILDLYEIMMDLSPDIDLLFKVEVSESVQDLTTKTIVQLADATRKIVLKFEESVLFELSMISSVKEGIHPYARYVVEYMKRMVNEYTETLSILITSNPSMEESYLKDYDNTKLTEIIHIDGKSPLALHFILIIALLLWNLKIKSEQYEIASFAPLFLVNNVNYIVQEVNGSAILNEMIGDENLKKLKLHIQHKESCYKNLTWGKIMEHLNEELLLHQRLRFLPRIHTVFSKCRRCSSEMLGLTLKWHLEFLNSMLEEIFQTQTTWLVTDQNLRQELHAMILEDLIPSYEAFLKLYSKKRRKLFKYSVKDLEIRVLGLFQG